MNTDWHIANKQFVLNRYPKGQHDKSLQAWDSADEYVIEHCVSEFDALIDKPEVTLVNDLFGALSVGLHNFQSTVVTDSHVSALAIEQNCQDNKLSTPKITNSLEAWPESSFIILKLTKNIGYLEYQLQQISQLSSNCKIIAAGKTTLVTSNTLKLFEKYLSNVSTSLAKKKSRLIFADHNSENNQLMNSKYPLTINWPEQNLTISSHANVFGKEQIDIGGRFLADNLPTLTSGQKIIDLGCGNGLLGLSCLKQIANSDQKVQICFTDESFMAVRSAQLNVENNFPDLLNACQFIQDDCLSSQENESADLILCNPPFHQQNTITEHIAKQMFRQSYDCLKANGSLLVVANRHLPYQNPLKKLFGGFTVLSQNNKFVIYQCNKSK